MRLQEPETASQTTPKTDGGCGAADAEPGGLIVYSHMITSRVKSWCELSFLEFSIIDFFCKKSKMILSLSNICMAVDLKGQIDGNNAFVQRKCIIFLM